MSTVVSVVIPAYNAGRFIGCALQSVLDQTFENFEVIVCDDGSTDDTLKIAMEFCLRDHRVFTISNGRNLGPAYSRNRAIENATGKWISLLDADDYFAPERLEKLVQFAERKRFDIVADCQHVVDIDGNYLYLNNFGIRYVRGYRTINFEEYIEFDMPKRQRHCLGFIQPIIRLEFLKAHHIAYTEGLSVGEDSLLFGQCLLRGAGLAIVDYASYFYRKVDGSLSRRGQPEDLLELQSTSRILAEELSGENCERRKWLLRRRAEMFQKEVFYLGGIRSLREGALIEFFWSLIRRPQYFSYFLRRIGSVAASRVRKIS